MTNSLSSLLQGSSNTSNIMLYDSWQERYALIREIPQESPLTVRIAKDKETGSRVTIKSISINCSREGVPSWVIRQIATHKHLEHENILRLLGVCVDRDSVNLIFEYANIIFNLKSFLRLPGNVPPYVMKSILRQILSAVAYCHSNKIIHRDLKPDNVLFDFGTRIVKIANFECARNVEVPPNVPATDNVGTACYRAPEVLLGSTNYTEAVDIWNVGCLIAEMILKEPIFDGDDNNDVLVQIFKYLGVPSEDTWPGVTLLCRDITTAYEIALGERKNLQEAVRGLDADGFELLNLMLKVNPTSRISASEALDHPYLKN